jgi:putative FmdB family regulatory protein
MPIYDYKCTACDHEVELMHKISETPSLACPGCGEETLKKQLSAAGFRLKGSGWYETDFKSGTKKNLADTGSSSSSGGGCGTGGCSSCG